MSPLFFACKKFKGSTESLVIKAEDALTSPVRRGQGCVVINKNSVDRLIFVRNASQKSGDSCLFFYNIALCARG